MKRILVLVVLVIALCPSKKAGGQSLNLNLEPGGKTPPVIAIQIGAVSFYDEGVDNVLDRVQELAGVNTIFIPVFAFNRGLAGRQLPGFKFPDHGKQEIDKDFTGGYYATPHEKYYQNSILKPKHFRARELGDYDVLKEVIPKAHARGIKVYAFIADNYGVDKPFSDQLCEVDINGENVGELNFLNPKYKEFLFALINDCVESYDIDGLLWRSERLGPISNTLNFNHYNTPLPTSFDEYTIARAKEKGINIEKTIQGYRELMSFVEQGKNGLKPVDGFYVTFWRIILKYPEILAWHQLFVDGLRAIYKDVYDFAKKIDPKLEVGWALSYKGMNNPFYRSRQDLQELGKYSDFLKVVMYSNVGGSRNYRAMKRVKSNIYGDMSDKEILDFMSNIMGFEKSDIETVDKDGLPVSLIRTETIKAIKGAEGTNTKIYSAIDIDMPAREGLTVIYTPERVKNQVIEAFRGGANGIIIARKYSEMNLSNLKGVGKALAELGLMDKKRF